jgi:hypothetical protein
VVVLALVLAAVSVPTIAGLTAWGLAGGDGTPRTAFHALLATGVGFGSIFNAVICYLALFRDVPAWQWWLMWVPPVAGLLGVLLASFEERTEGSARDWLLGLGMQLTLALPAVLLLAAGVVVV